MDYKRFEGVKRSYRRLQRILKRLHGVTAGYRRLQQVTRDYK